MMIKYTDAEFSTVVNDIVINAKKKIKGCCEVSAEKAGDGDCVCSKCNNEMFVSAR